MANLSNAMLLKPPGNALVLTNLLGLYNGSTTTLGSVSSWADLSGNGNSLPQGTTLNQPVSTAAQQNGKSTLLFTGTAPSELVIPSGLWGLPNGACTVFVVSKRTVDTGIQPIYAMTTSGNTPQQAIFYNGAGVVEGTNDSSNGSFISLTGVTTTNYNIFCMTFDGAGTVGFSVNNGTPVTGAGSVSSSVAGGLVGHQTSGNFSLTGGVAEMALYNAKLSVGNIAQNFAFLNSQWAIY